MLAEYEQIVIIVAKPERAFDVDRALTVPLGQQLTINSNVDETVAPLPTSPLPHRVADTHIGAAVIARFVEKSLADVFHCFLAVLVTTMSTR